MACGEFVLESQRVQTRQPRGLFEGEPIICEQIQSEDRTGLRFGQAGGADQFVVENQLHGVEDVRECYCWPSLIHAFPTMTENQIADARATYASMVITGTSVSEEEAMEIAERFYASDVPERVAALRTHPEMSYEEARFPDGLARFVPGTRLNLPPRISPG